MLLSFLFLIKRVHIKILAIFLVVSSSLLCANNTKASRLSSDAFERSSPAETKKLNLSQPACSQGHVYLTFDTGNMASAELIAQILQRHQIKASFFLANEKTFRGDYALDDSWATYWKARVQEGHVFGSHTFDHVYFQTDSRDGGLTVKPEFGSQAGKLLSWSANDVCLEISRVKKRFYELTGADLSPIWRAPGGRLTPLTLRAARGCGYAHIPWTSNGFLGDELSSEKFSNSALLEKAQKNIQANEILLMHLGIWSRRTPLAPILDPLIVDLKQRGICFSTLRNHPQYYKHFNKISP